jgi:hypothetical protein
MMYASKIEIIREPKVIKFTKKVTIYDGKLTLNILSQHMSNDQTFEVYREDGELYPDNYHLEIHCERLETQDEVNERIAKQEKYNENYEKFRAKYKK